MNLVHLIDRLLAPGVLTPLASIVGVIVTAFLAVHATKRQSRDLTRQLTQQTERAYASRVAEHEAQLRRERLEVYRRYLEASHKVTATFHPVEDGTWEQRRAEAVRAEAEEWNIRTEVSLISSPEVADATRELHKLQQARRREWAQLWDPALQPDGEREPRQNPPLWGTAADSCVAQTSFLIHLMRQEMTAGVEASGDHPAHSTPAE